MSQAETWTVGRLLTWTTDFLQKHDSETPRLDAEVLLAHARGCERIALYTAFGEEVSEEVRGQFRELVKKRSEGMPVAYLVGKKEFFSLSFKVTPDVLIPRPETEFVVMAALDVLRPGPRKGSGFRLQASEEESGESKNPQSAIRNPQLADVGTGSGCIAIAVAKHAPQASLVATDVSAAALAVARENAQAHQVADRLEFHQGDLLSMLPAQRQFDLIVSNPPYIGTTEQGTLAPQVRQHEPHSALFGGERGIETIARLIPQAAERMKPGGWLILEVSPLVADAVLQLIVASDVFEPAGLSKDLAGLVRVIQARRRL
ncbi:MAG TPA: peptide chain release factor N(5)-glutamine methyltransferase [Pirellulaceae bacterium]|nr:peptide chain release factor N(5)-glutamine methyltransferase [Pirellulaceae bacterium]